MKIDERLNENMGESFVNEKKEMVVKATGIELYTESFGQNINPVVLLISGMMTSGHFWTDEFCKKLASSGYFVLRYDHRDTGLSGHVDFEKNPYKFEDLAKDAIAILDEYGIKKTHIVGHSMGGAIAQMLALDFSSRVLSVTTISSVAIGSVEYSENEKKALESVGSILSANAPTDKFEESVDCLMASYKSFHGSLPIDENFALEYIRDIYYRSKPEHLAVLKKDSAAQGNVHNHVRAYHGLPDRIKELKTITVPVFVINGELDNLCFARIAKEYIADKIPGVKMIIIPGMGHMVLSNDLFEKICDIMLENFNRH